MRDLICMSLAITIWNIIILEDFTRVVFTKLLGKPIPPKSEGRKSTSSNENAVAVLAAS